MKEWGVSEGRLFRQGDLERHAKVVVLGTTGVTDLFGTANTHVVGTTVDFGGTALQVIGVLKSKGSNGSQDQDDVAMIPVTTMQDHYTGSTSGYSQLLAQATSASTSSAANSEIISVLASDHNI